MTPMYTTHSFHDRHEIGLTAPIEGMRDGWIDRMIQHPTNMTEAERRGYLSALYSIRNSFLPGAYARSATAWRFQTAIDRIITELTVPPIEPDYYDADPAGLPAPSINPGE